MNERVLIVSAPSGAGKTTIVKEILKKYPCLGFSVSATNRAKRPGEVNGRDYYFLTKEDFLQKAKDNQFIEWEEVYPGTYYGTLKEELSRLSLAGKRAIFDVDVMGGIQLKSIFGPCALALFIQPPSLEILEQRLKQRGTENEESIRKRIGKASYEMSFADKFDSVIVNSDLSQALEKVFFLIDSFLNNK